MTTMLNTSAAHKPKFRVPRIPDREQVAHSSIGVDQPPKKPKSDPTPPPSPAPEGGDQAKAACALTPASIQSLLSPLLEDYLTLSLPITALAKRHNLKLHSLLMVLESAEFQALLMRINRLATQRAEILAVHARATAINSLETTIATSIDPETERKACATLMRASDRVIYPARRPPKHTERTAPSETSPQRELRVIPPSPEPSQQPEERAEPGVDLYTHVSDAPQPSRPR